MKKLNFVRIFGFLLIFAMASGIAAPTFAQSKKDRDRAKKVAKQGDDLFNKKDYRGAIDKYAQAIVYFPGFAAAHYWKAVAHSYLKENDQALVDFDAALATGYDKPVEIYRIRWLIYYDKGDLDGALRDATEVARLEPKNANIQFALGGINRERKQYAEALAAYKRGVQINPDQGDIHFFIADCYYNLGDYLNQGFAALDALKYKTKYVGESNFYVADALYRAKKFDEAIPYFEATISVKPDIYAAYGPLADIYRNKSRFNEAIATAKKGLAVFPNDANLYVSLSWFYSMADMPKEASIAAQSAINLDPKIAMGYTNLCRSQNDLKQYSQALQSCNSALRLNPGDGESYLYMGRAYEFLNQPERAADSYNKAIPGLLKFTQDNPDYSDGFYLLGNAYFALQKDEQAIAAYKECLRLSPNFARARYTLGYSYNATGNKTAAREQYNILRNLDADLAARLLALIEGK